MKPILLILIGLFSPLVLAKALPTYHAYQLDNGLQVVIIPNHRAPVVYHSLWYKVGSADSPTNKTGLAHFLEHLMFKGTKQFPKDTFKKVINDLGGEQNANTSWDRTLYFVTIAKEHLATVMEMEADRMQNLILTDEEVAKEKEVVLQERRSTVDSRPERRLFEAANANFFWEHPYGTPVIGFEEHIRSYTKQDASIFYKKWYNPNSAILVISGDVVLADIKPQIKEYYGKLKNRAQPKRNRLQEPQHRGATSMTQLRDPQLSGTFIQWAYPTTNFRLGGLKQDTTLTLLQDILGDSTYGRLNKNLVEDQKLAQFVSAEYTGHYYDPYSFTITAAPYNTFDLPVLEASITAEIKRLIAEGVDQHELETAKQQWTFEALYRQDSIYGIADLFGEGLSVDYTLQDIENWMPQLRSVTAEDIKKAAKETLGSEPLVKLQALPTVHQ